MKCELYLHEAVFCFFFFKCGVCMYMCVWSAGYCDTHIVIPELGRLREEEQKFKARMGYTVSSRPTWVK
jgi:hypothetical protein